MRQDGWDTSGFLEQQLEATFKHVKWHKKALVKQLN